MSEAGGPGEAPGTISRLYDCTTIRPELNVCPRCGRTEHTRWDDDPLPPAPLKVADDGTFYIDVATVIAVVGDVRAAYRRRYAA